MKRELVKQTELELIAQAALIAAVYKSEVAALVKLDGKAGDYGRKVKLAPAGDERFPSGETATQLVALSHSFAPGGCRGHRATSR